MFCICEWLAVQNVNQAVHNAKRASPPWQLDATRVIDKTRVRHLPKLAVKLAEDSSDYVSGPVDRLFERNLAEKSTADNCNICWEYGRENEL